jgi:cobalt-zinc-cadmium efflux system protein
VIIAGVALAIDAATAALTYAMSKTSVNIRAAFLHNLADALGSLAVIVAGSLIILFDWRLVDPIVTLGIAGYILWMSFAEAGHVIRILMLGSPPGIDTDAVLQTIRDVDGVAGVHNSRFWQMDEHHSSIDAHVVVDTGDWARADGIKASVKRALRDIHGIEHSTIELEIASNACDGPPVYGN